MGPVLPLKDGKFIRGELRNAAGSGRGPWHLARRRRISRSTKDGRPSDLKWALESPTERALLLWEPRLVKSREQGSATMRPPPRLRLKAGRQPARRCLLQSWHGVRAAYPQCRSSNANSLRWRVLAQPRRVVTTSQIHS